MKVKALKPGYYDHKLRAIGEEFDLLAIDGLALDGKPKHFSSEQLFSSKWMEKVEAEEQPKMPSKKVSSKVSASASVI